MAAGEEAAEAGGEGEEEDDGRGVAGGEGEEAAAGGATGGAAEGVPKMSKEIKHEYSSRCTKTRAKILAFYLLDVFPYNLKSHEPCNRTNRRLL